MPNIIASIEKKPLPGDITEWWKQMGPQHWGGQLEDEEIEYVNFFTSEQVPSSKRMPLGRCHSNNLAYEERQEALELFEDPRHAFVYWANRETRKRILKHYVFTHPLMVQYYGALYRLFRDVNPTHATVERVYQVGTGEEMFTGIKISRAWAAVELISPIIVGRIFKIALSYFKPGGAFVGPPVPPKVPTTEVWELPPRGGSMIAGRYYTEHALERMAPDTPAVRALLQEKAAFRLQRMGIASNSPAYQECFDYFVKKIHPRGVPPMVVEAEIRNPGSTSVRVITAKNKSVVVTVILKESPKLKGPPVPQGKVPSGAPLKGIWK